MTMDYGDFTPAECLLIFAILFVGAWLTEKR